MCGGRTVCLCVGKMSLFVGDGWGYQGVPILWRGVHHPPLNPVCVYVGGMHVKPLTPLP